jgi:energy-coupling factor transporter ATP-binding protein EcfA2
MNQIVEGNGMVLRNFQYSERIEAENEWSVNDFSLNPKVNLLVAKNATGKTNIIKRISSLAHILTGDAITFAFGSTESYEVQFENGDVIFNYTVSVKNMVTGADSDFNTIKSEELKLNNTELKLERKENGLGRIWAEKKNEFIDFQVPVNQLVVFSRQDALQHPYLASLVRWASGLLRYDFATNLGQDEEIIDIMPMKNKPNTYSRNNPVELYYIIENEMPSSMREAILSSINSLDYDIEDIGIGWDKNRQLGYPTRQLFVQDKDNHKKIYQKQMSQGMFRAFSLLIQLHFNIFYKIPTTILIDDIGEGLDFDRSTKLIHLLIDLAEHNDIQLIMSTNDRYVMNGVPLKYWQVIDRKGGECKVYNYQNSKEKFDEFDYTGLSNFDFLATDYINSEWKPA